MATMTKRKTMLVVSLILLLGSCGSRSGGALNTASQPSEDNQSATCMDQLGLSSVSPSVDRKFPGPCVVMRYSGRRDRIDEIFLYHYDPHGQVIDQKFYDAGTCQITGRRQYSYDSNGRQIAERFWDNDSQGHILSVYSNDTLTVKESVVVFPGESILFERQMFDDNRLVVLGMDSGTDALPSVEMVEYENDDHGNWISRQRKPLYGEQLARCQLDIQKHEYNEHGKLMKTTLDECGDGTSDQIVFLSYDQNERLMKELTEWPLRGIQNETDYQYCQSGWTVSEKASDGSLSKQKHFDKSGLLLSEKRFDSDGRVQSSESRTYDKFGNLIETSVQDAGHSAESGFSYRYDCWTN